MTKRAEDFHVVRRVPLENFSFSFLITKKHVDCFSKRKKIDWILDFMVEVDSEISSLKIFQNARGRAIAIEYMKLFA
jgi:actin related protein 2/3 complex subunit 4